MARIDDLFDTALRSLEAKPTDNASAPEKKAYSEKLSAAIALALADELRHRGLKEARPAGPGQLDSASGAERRMAGGIGAKKVDVTWATEEAGLLLGISIKTINFRDNKTGNFQKNLTNRRGDMLMEAVTLHRRFPYAVLAAFFFLDSGAKNDHERTKPDALFKSLPATARRRSTFLNAHARLRLFTDRNDPAGRDEQFERFYIFLVEATPESSHIEAYKVGEPNTPLPLSDILDDLLVLTAERNPDFYEYDSGRLTKLQS